METREIKTKEVWEDFLLNIKEKTFLSSWNWGEFQKLMGSGSNGKIWRLGVFERSELIAVALAIKVSARRGTFILIPHGPNIRIEADSQRFKVLESLLAKLREIGKSEKADFIRINPIIGGSKENEEIFGQLGFRKAPVHAHPEASWKLDITVSEDQLLAKMRKTTRYLIKQAQKDKEIEVFQGKELKDVEVLIRSI